MCFRSNWIDSLSFFIIKTLGRLGQCCMLLSAHTNQKPCFHSRLIAFQFMPRWKSSILIDIRTSFQPIKCIWKLCIFLLTTCGVWWWVGYVKWQSRLQISCSVYLNQYSTIIQCQIHPGWKTSSAQIDQIDQIEQNWSNWAKCEMRLILILITNPSIFAL